MTEIPVDKDTWYKLRDDRTGRVDDVQGFEKYRIGVLVDDKVRQSYSVQVITLLSLNMAARWCRNITIQIPEKIVSVIPGHQKQDYVDYLKHEMAHIDPFGNFIFGSIDVSAVDGILYIGCSCDTSYNSLWIDGNGWLAGIGTASSSQTTDEPEYMNPIGPAFSACLGAAALFRKAIGMELTLSNKKWYSMYDFKTSPNPSELLNPDNYSGVSCGRILQVGCGAVGSSLDYLLSLTTHEGEILLMDFDKVDISNCNRSLAFNSSDAFQSRSKVDVCCKTLKSNNAKVIGVHGSFKEYVSKGSFLDVPPDVVLCLANEQNVWSDIQNNYPPIVLHSTTTPNWGINFGRHIPKKEWCIMCRFSKEIDNSFTPVCGEVEIDRTQSETPTLGVLPFLSPTAAVFTLAEFGKISSSGIVNKNFVQFSMKVGNSSILSMQRASVPSCICDEQEIDDYPVEITSSKYWNDHK